MHRGRGADWQRGREVEMHWSRDVDMQRSRGAGKHMGRWQMAEGKGQSAEIMHEELLNNLAIA